MRKVKIIVFILLLGICIFIAYVKILHLFYLTLIPGPLKGNEIKILSQVLDLPFPPNKSSIRVFMTSDQDYRLYVCIDFNTSDLIKIRSSTWLRTKQGIPQEEQDIKIRPKWWWKPQSSDEMFYNRDIDNKTLYVRKAYLRNMGEKATLYIFQHGSFAKLPSAFLKALQPGKLFAAQSRDFYREWP
jgi:hypothetical protein